MSPIRTRPARNPAMQMQAFQWLILASSLISYGAAHPKLETRNVKLPHELKGQFLIKPYISLNLKELGYQFQLPGFQKPLIVLSQPCDGYKTNEMKPWIDGKEPGLLTHKCRIHQPHPHDPSYVSVQDHIIFWPVGNGCAKGEKLDA